MNNIPETEEYNHLFQIVLVGDANVGQTHLLNRYVKGMLPKSPVNTIGVQFATKTVTLHGGQKIKTQIWDTAGQQRYRSITSAHYRRSVGALLVYDITQEQTFASVAQWMEDIKYQAEPDIVIMLVGNKLDLVQQNPSLRKVSRDEAQNFAHDNKLLFEEASAVSAKNVNEAFDTLLQEIFQVQSQRRDNLDTSVQQNLVLDHYGNGPTEGNKGNQGCKC